ncbi:hypothetical protein GZH47_03015 [Paenibacillus rhizovicinus]|uniref:Uncharacterized protein n=1 Tax=Paenibacillus rhizovicinus TaxID=2704463 RepID=A0A6C0NUL6_9BACL|nr:hypothetical protein [Paenibacillus rhizovicinus]QHW29904.1 hypothetical protein GZH47_03015 [Paenibacillus rhizovicinus]
MKNKLFILSTVCGLVISSSILSSVSAEDVSSTSNLVNIKNEIEKIKIEDAAYYLQELKQQSNTQKAKTLSEMGINTNEVNNESTLEEVAQEMVDQSYIYG